MTTIAAMIDHHRKRHTMLMESLEHADANTPRDYRRSAYWKAREHTLKAAEAAQTYADQLEASLVQPADYPKEKVA